mmetsp:Transcript_34770/g.98093  ORF Transcript_34770/g.98093 Transcript_34770/m.98093 type:complete len:202 (-) Transcript_34770:676-1281(-)
MPRSTLPSIRRLSLSRSSRRRRTGGRMQQSGRKSVSTLARGLTGRRSDRSGPLCAGPFVPQIVALQTLPRQPSQRAPWRHPPSVQRRPQRVSHLLKRAHSQRPPELWRPRAVRLCEPRNAGRIRGARSAGGSLPPPLRETFPLRHGALPAAPVGATTSGGCSSPAQTRGGWPSHSAPRETSPGRGCTLRRAALPPWCARSL